jgi:glycogen debranching enzyme
VGDGTLRVLLAPSDPADSEAEAAWAWLASLPDVESKQARPTMLADALGGFSPHVVWLHGPAPVLDSGAFAPLFPGGPDARERDDGAPGPGLLLTGGAATLPHRMGMEPVAPAEEHRLTWRHRDDELYLFTSFSSFHHIRGHCSFRGHPLFAGLGHGAFTWRPCEGEDFVRVSYVHPDWPAKGRVIAVERSYIHVNPRRATIWEYDAGPAGRAGGGQPRILCIGAYLPFAAPDHGYRIHREQLTHNALQYAAGVEAGLPHAGTRRQHAGVWVHHPPTVKHDPDLPLPEVPALDRPLPSFHHPLVLEGEAARDRTFTLSGRRLMIAGDEVAGVHEVWAHPLRVLSSLQVEGAAARHASVTPLGVERRLEVGAPGAPPAPLVERIFAAYGVPLALVEWVAAAPLELRLTWRVDLRLMWPYPPGALGPLRWRAHGRTLHVAAGPEAHEGVTFVLSRQPVESWRVEDVSTDAAPALEVAVTLKLEAGESARLAVAARVDAEEGDGALAALEDAPALVHTRAAALDPPLREGLAVKAPDPRVSEALDWAKYRLDSYLVDTPGVGRSLVAGYWKSRPDWFHEGRPGYAWYFGRDAVWTALGSLAVGQFEAVRHVLRFLGEHQDPTGIILHECTTSGLVHYDAADSTPLYLLLAARYFAWTGDAAFIRSQWGRLRRAYAFCLGTDRDGDGLMENTGVGHGWIEFGRLGGGTVTHYNGAIWATALGELAEAAERVGDGDFAEELRSRAGRAREALERTFFDPARGQYALNVKRAGPGQEAHLLWEPEWEQTAMQAVPLLLGAADPDRMAGWLDAIAGHDFTAGWGVRMLPVSAPDYDPQSYHGGSVWPLFTGWVSWAEYEAGRAEAGFRHWWMNLEQGFSRQRGAWDEVLHGLEHRAAGVCPDQAWSTAMVVAPFVYGLLGVVPDAPHNRLRLAPQIPQEWPELDVERLRVGDGQVSLRYRRVGSLHTFRMVQTSGAAPLTLHFEPAIQGRRLEAARVDGRPTKLDAVRRGEGVRVPVDLVLDRVRTVELEIS